mgnify:CR=1 FL=1
MLIKNFFVLIFHRIIFYLKLEEIIYFLSKRFSLPSWKLIPQNNLYKKNNKINCKRENLFFNIERHDFTHWQIYAGYPECHFMAFQMCKIKSGIVLDIGSHIGVFSLKVAQFKRINNLKKLNIHAFEPCNETFENLSKNISINQLESFIYTKKYALSNLNKESWIEKNSSNSGGNRINLIGNKNSENFEKIITKRLDDHNFDDESIKFLKIDTEGHEIDVIEGGKNTIEKFKPSIFLEVSEELYLKTGKTFLDTFEQLREYYAKFYIEKIGYSVSFQVASASEVITKIKMKKTFNMLITNQ